MKWPEAHHVHFLKEITLYQKWNLRKSRVIKRSIRARYLPVERKYKKKIAEEDKASGISTEPTELANLMEDIVAFTQNWSWTKENLEKKLLKLKKLEEWLWKHLKKQNKETQMKNPRRNREQVVLMLL